MNLFAFENKKPSLQTHTIKITHCFSVKFFLASFLLSGLLIFLFLPFAKAQQAEFKGRYQDWSLYTRNTKEGKICYILSKPKDSNPKTVRHGSVYFMIASWKSGITHEQPNVLVGYPMKKTATPVLSINRQRFEMFVSGREAFIESNKIEKNLIKKMKLGSDMSFHTRSARGTKTSYRFSLRGVTKALEKMQTLCS